MDRTRASHLARLELALASCPVSFDVAHHGFLACCASDVARRDDEWCLSRALLNVLDPGLSSVRGNRRWRMAGGRVLRCWFQRSSEIDCGRLRPGPAAVDSADMDLKDATLMILNESAAYPTVAKIAQSAYDQLTRDGEVDHRVLSDMIGEASGKGVLQAIQQKCSGTAHEAMLAPILREIDRQKPVPPRRVTAVHKGSADPLTAGSW